MRPSLRLNLGAEISMIGGVYVYSLRALNAVAIASMVTLTADPCSLLHRLGNKSNTELTSSRINQNRLLFHLFKKRPPHQMLGLAPARRKDKYEIALPGQLVQTRPFGLFQRRILFQ